MRYAANSILDRAGVFVMSYNLSRKEPMFISSMIRTNLRGIFDEKYLDEIF